MLILLMLIIMFPGMITGSSTAAVLSAGAIVAPILLMMGIPAPQTGAILAVGAIMGMAAPPVNIPAMLIAGGVDMPYIGFEGPPGLHDLKTQHFCMHSYFNPITGDRKNIARCAYSKSCNDIGILSGKTVNVFRPTVIHISFSD